VLTGIAIAVAGLYLALAAYLYAYQRDFLYFPDLRKPDASSIGLAGLKEVQLDTSDGLHLLAWYVPPPEGKPVVLYFPGNGGNLNNRGDRLLRLANAGMGVLMPEYRGYGGNAGNPSESSFYTDAEAAMAFLRNDGIADDRIVLYGESLGTGVATRLASEHKVAALILEAPYTSITAMAAAQFYFLPISLMLKDRFGSLSRIGNIHAPILVLQGDRDEIVPPALGQQLFAAAPEPKELWSARGGGHNDLVEFGALDAVISFLSRHVASLR